MDITFFGQGLLIGFAIAAPVGAIGLLCIRRTLVDGPLVGSVSGLGAATADACYGAIAAGLTSISSVLISHQNQIRVIGGLVLCYLGVRTMVRRPEPGVGGRSAKNLAAAYGSTFALTLTNPSMILSFAAVFAGLGLANITGPQHAALLVLGVFLGSALWWLVLTSALGRYRHRITPTRLRWVNRMSGMALAGFGVVALRHVYN